MHYVHDDIIMTQDDLNKAYNDRVDAMSYALGSTVIWTRYFQESEWMRWLRQYKAEQEKV